MHLKVCILFTFSLASLPSGICQISIFNYNYSEIYLNFTPGSQSGSESGRNFDGSSLLLYPFILVMVIIQVITSLKIELITYHHDKLI